MNESMDYIPHTAILRKVSGLQRINDEIPTLSSDEEVGGVAPRSHRSPIAKRHTLSRQDSTYKQRRFLIYLKSRGKSLISSPESLSPLVKSELDIHRKIDSLGKLLDDRIYQKAESNAHYQQILEGMSKQLEVCYILTQ